jgi:hypothetical protein
MSVCCNAAIVPELERTYCEPSQTLMVGASGFLSSASDVGMRALGRCDVDEEAGDDGNGAKAGPARKRSPRVVACSRSTRTMLSPSTTAAEEMLASPGPRLDPARLRALKAGPKA